MSIQQTERRVLYLQFPDAATNTTREEVVEHRSVPSPRRGQTISGYGSRIPTETMVYYRRRWHRVYVRCYGNVGTGYIISRGKQILVEARWEAVPGSIRHL